MNLEQIQKDIPIQCVENLSALYVMVCEEYRRRLCGMWDFDFEDSYWMADVIGESLFVGDWIWALDMAQIIYIVEHNVSHGAMLEYQSFVEDELSKGCNYPRINFLSWMKGLRPEMLKDNGEHTKD